VLYDANNQEEVVVEEGEEAEEEEEVVEDHRPHLTSMFPNNPLNKHRM